MIRAQKAPPHVSVRNLQSLPAQPMVLQLGLRVTIHPHPGSPPYVSVRTVDEGHEVPEIHTKTPLVQVAVVHF